MKFLPFTMVALLVSLSSICQQPAKFGKVSSEEIQRKVYSIDSSANAVVLFDVGSTEIKGNTKGWFSLEYKRHRRIHILNKNGYDQATFGMVLYTDGESEELLEDLKATAYNYEGGKVVETKLDKGSVFKDKLGKNHIRKKFTLPNVKEGTIIEYEYKLTSDFLFNLQPWSFQGDIPVLWSEYKVYIPQFLNYVLVAQGSEPFFVRDQVDKKGDYWIEEQVNRDSYGGTRRTEKYNIVCGVTQFRWAMKDVPALTEEAYITTLRNYNSRLEFQLSGYQAPLTPLKVMTTWPDLTSRLLKHADFGVQLEAENTGWVTGVLPAIIGSASSYTDKAKKIYKFVRDNFTCTSYDDIYLEKPLKEVYKNKTGNVAEINLLLTALLRNAGVFSEPVILSTRENGFVYSRYPVIGRFNHVISRCIIDDTEILMDASRPLPFGQLDAACYNGQARVVNESATILMLNPDQLIEKKTVQATLQADNNGKYTAKVSEAFGNNESAYYLKLLNEKGKEGFRQSMKEKLGAEMTFTELETGTADVDDPLLLRYAVSYNNEAADIMYINPIISTSRLSKNPFRSASRKYPVEMPYKISESYTLSMTVPAGYTIDELPKPLLLKLNAEQDMVYEYNISQIGNEIKLICRTEITRAKFESVEYNHLRSFFDKVVAKQNEQIVLKKKP